MIETKPYEISKWAVYTAYERVKANKGSYGVDEQSIEDFEKNLKNNLYKIWNRMFSGSYFPPTSESRIYPQEEWWNTHAWHSHRRRPNRPNDSQTVL